MATGSGPCVLDSAEIDAVHIFHHVVVRAIVLIGIECRDDVGMNQSGCGMHLLLEATDRILVDQRFVVDLLERHNSLHAAVLSLEHLAHAALSKLVDNHVLAKHELLLLALEQTNRLVLR